MIYVKNLSKVTARDYERKIYLSICRSDHVDTFRNKKGYINYLVISISYPIRSVNCISFPRRISMYRNQV